MARKAVSTRRSGEVRSGNGDKGRQMRSRTSTLFHDHIASLSISAILGLRDVPAERDT